MCAFDRKTSLCIFDASSHCATYFVVYCHTHDISVVFCVFPKYNNKKRTVQTKLMSNHNKNLYNGFEGGGTAGSWLNVLVVMHGAFDPERSLWTRTRSFDIWNEWSRCVLVRLDIDWWSNRRCLFVYNVCCPAPEQSFDIQTTQMSN